MKKQYIQPATMTDKTRFTVNICISSFTSNLDLEIIEGGGDPI